MTVGANSYGTVAEVEAFTKHLLDGAIGFDNSTRPTVSEVEKFIDRLSAILNSALAGVGFDIPVTQGDVKLALDDWVVLKCTGYVELTARGAGSSDDPNARPRFFNKLHSDASAFVRDNARGWQRLGAALDNVTSTGFSYTGMDKHSERADPDNTGREQPKFRRGQWEPT